MARFIRARGLLSFIAARLLFAVIPGIRYFSPGLYMHMRNPIWGFYLYIYAYRGVSFIFMVDLATWAVSCHVAVY